jgi:hypothetical protein
MCINVTIEIRIVPNMRPPWAYNYNILYVLFAKIDEFGKIAQV